MPFRSNKHALAHRVDKLSDDVAERDQEISELRVALSRRDSRPPLERERRWQLAVLLLTALAIVLMVVAGAVWRSPAKTSSHEVARWALPHTPPDRAAPLLVDVDGDGVEEFLGRFEGNEPRGRYLGLFDGNSRRLRWRLGPYTPLTEPQHLAVSEGLLLLVDGRHGVVHSLADGQRRTEVTLPAEVVSLCHSPTREGPVWLMVAGEGHQLLDLGSGALEPSARPTWCTNHGVRAAPAIAGFSAEVALVEGTHMVALARRLAGSGEATLLGFRRGDDQTSWQRPLVAGTPSAAARPPRPGQQAVLHEGRLFVAFHDRAGNTNHLEAVDATHGKTLWQTSLPHDASNDVRAMAAGSRYLYVAHGAWLSVFDVASGELVEVLGEPPRD